MKSKPRQFVFAYFHQSVTPLGRMWRFILACATILYAASASGVDEWTVHTRIRYIQVNTGTPAANYYLHTNAWGAPGCQNATVVMIRGDVPGAKEMLAVAMLARALGEQVNILGECQDSQIFIGKVIQVIDW